MKVLLDTNILIDYLLGYEKAANEIGLYKDPAISAITYAEVLVGSRDADDATSIRRFLDTFIVLEFNTQIAIEAAYIRKEHRIKLPDAMIWATARVHNRLLVTRNTKAFSASDPSVRNPYTL